MRPLLIGLACGAAVAGGFFLALACLGHPVAILQLWNTGNGLYTAGTSTSTTAGTGGDVNQWKPPEKFPAHDNWTWHVKGGKEYNDVVITSISPTEVTITHSLGVAHIPLDLLPPDVQGELQYTPPPGSTNAGAIELTPVAAMLDKKLIDASGRAVPTPGASVKYYAIYYSAGWCPPCHAFTPTLVEWYRNFKPHHPNFELIFVSEDRSESAMGAYMSEMQMPWPAVNYNDLPRTNGAFRGPDIQKFVNDGIPDLVLVDSSGAVLADSYNGTTYVGPQSVVDYMNANLGN